MDVRVYVKPGSSKGPLVHADSEGCLTVYVREPAVDGRANEAVVTVLAEHYHVPKTQVSLIRGAASRHKVLHIML